MICTAVSMLSPRVSQEPPGSCGVDDVFNDITGVVAGVDVTGTDESESIKQQGTMYMANNRKKCLVHI